MELKWTAPLLSACMRGSEPAAQGMIGVQTAEDERQRCVHPMEMHPGDRKGASHI